MSPPAEGFSGGSGLPDPPSDVGLLAPVWVGTAAESLTSDREVTEAMVRFESALLHTLAEHGMAPRLAFGPPDIDVRALAERAVDPGNPTMPLVDLLRHPAAGGIQAADTPGDPDRIHHGATSQDVVDSALMLVSTSVADRIAAELVDLARSLADLVAEHRSTPCVARTLTQQAMPTTLGFRVACWLDGVLDARESVRACLPLPLSLGGPVGTSAAYGSHGPAVAGTLARELGLAAPALSWHTNRAPVLRLAACLTEVGNACGRIAADLLLMSQTEIGEADDGSSGRSSAMAHKANPTRSVLVASAARQLPGLLATVASSGASGSERAPGAWHAEWQPLRTMLRLAGAAVERTTRTAEQMSFDTGAMRRNLGTLLTALDHDDAWAAEQTAHVGVWIDRVLARHGAVCPS